MHIGQAAKKCAYIRSRLYLFVADYQDRLRKVLRPDMNIFNYCASATLLTFI
jgi:hypothetical protein